MVMRLANYNISCIIFCMFGLIIIIILVVLGIYYVTTLNFEIGSGVSEEKSQAKEGEYTVHKPEPSKKILDKNN